MISHLSLALGDHWTLLSFPFLALLPGVSLSAAGSDNDMVNCFMLSYI